jgi:hypothetical protein
MRTIRLLLAAALPLLGACRPDAPPEPPPRLKPLLETLVTRYRPLTRQDTLSSYWAPDSLWADSLFHLTDAYAPGPGPHVALCPERIPPLTARSGRRPAHRGAQCLLGGLSLRRGGRGPRQRLGGVRARVSAAAPRVPRPDTLYPYLAHQRPFPWRHQRIPLVADQPDTTRHALLRLSFRVLHHSAD